MKDINKIMKIKLARVRVQLEKYFEKHPEKVLEKEMLIKRLSINRLS